MKIPYLAPALALALLSLTAAPPARAHCDTLNGPVVQDARTAIAKSDVTPVLKWVSPENEPAMRAVFAKTLAVRKHSAAAAEVADTHFFETLVRLHRAGEGEPFTGLKAEPPDKGALAADQAIARSTGDQIRRELNALIQSGLEGRLERVVAARKHADDSIEAGRVFVAAYVDFLHFAERLFAIAGSSAAAPHEH